MMLDSFETLFMAEQDYLRFEAMDLFERCLTEGNPHLLTNFIHQQIVENPLHLTLLQHIADDVEQRSLALREHHPYSPETAPQQSADQSPKVSKTSFVMTAQLHDDLVMIEQLLSSLRDWIQALSCLEVRRNWSNSWQSSAPELIH